MLKVKKTFVIYRNCLEVCYSKKQRNEIHHLSNVYLSSGIFRGIRRCLILDFKI